MRLPTDPDELAEYQVSRIRRCPFCWHHLRFCSCRRVQQPAAIETDGWLDEMASACGLPLHDWQRRVLRSAIVKESLDTTQGAPDTEVMETTPTTQSSRPVLCPHCLEQIADGSETAEVHNGDDRYPNQIMHIDCAADGYRDAYPITWPNGETTDEVES